MKYFFVLGRNHSLSKLEIVTFLSKKLDYKIIAASHEILILETDQIINSNELISKLGGTVKIGEVIDSISPIEWQDQFDKKIVDPNFLSKIFNPEIKKISFGVSVYNADEENYANRLFPQIIKKLPAIKKFLQSSYKTNFVKSHERSVSSVSVLKNGLISTGFELIVIAGKEIIFLGKTLAVQNFEDYSFRDYQRPGRNTEAGMIPPKLAQIMINLSGKELSSSFLDPFCGNGTILQEEILLGIKDITGTDYKDEQIQKTIQNIQWLFESYSNLNKSEFNIRIMQSDVRTLNKKIDEKSIDAIVTEPFLGSSKSKQFNFSQIKNEISSLEKLYLDAFYQFKLLLRQNGVVVVVFPVFKTGNELHYLQILTKLNEYGFIPIDFQKKFEKLNLEISKRGSIIYFRPDQTIQREIFVFENVGSPGFEPGTSSM